MIIMKIYKGQKEFEPVVIKLETKEEFEDMKLFFEIPLHISVEKFIRERTSDDDFKKRIKCFGDNMCYSLNNV